MAQMFIALALLTIVLIYAVLALTDIDLAGEQRNWERKPLVTNKSKVGVPGDE